MRSAGREPFNEVHGSFDNARFIRPPLCQRLIGSRVRSIRYAPIDLRALARRDAPTKRVYHVCSIVNAVRSFARPEIRRIGVCLDETPVRINRCTLAPICARSIRIPEVQTTVRL
ncbi:uncharacterized protein LOC143152616 [Ptiloglossa arizonensis]|uniref:uncharacterized protein LOC143152616 n=1 Tax=Ptiloglossa arizonensis TaxID=3350558 RepID=UPI003FA05CB8